MTSNQMKNDVAEMFGSFFLNESEFVLPVKNIQEVVNSPKKLTPMPLAPNYMLGVFNLRGVIVPVLDLKFLLNLEQKEQSLENKKIAIVEFDEVRIGLLLDGTGQIFRNQENERSDFTYVNSVKSVVSGAIKLDEGKRIVQILDVIALVGLEKVPHSQQGTGLVTARNKKNKNQGTRSQCISFFVEKNRLGLGIESIYEIIKPPPLKPSAIGFGKACIGMFELRGDVIPVVDFASLLKYRELKEQSSISTDQRVIVMKIGNAKIGLLIESVESIITYFADDLLYLPVLNQEKTKMFIGCLSKEGIDDILLLKSDEILSTEELSALTQGHSQLYQSSTNDSKKNKKLTIRKSYISFKVDRLFAIEMDEVKELIEYPKQMIQPPSLSSCIKGMLNLRGKLVTIIDTRILYNVEQTFEFDNAKVLIFEKMGFSFGLIVDSVENIVSFAEVDHVKLPSVFYRTNEGSAMSDDVKFAVTVKVSDQEKNIMILNLDSLIKKIGFVNDQVQEVG